MTDPWTSLETLLALVWRASWHGALLTLVVLVALRLLGRSLSAGGRSALWLIVFLRLMLPWTPECAISLDRLFAASPASWSGPAWDGDADSPAEGSLPLPTKASSSPEVASPGVPAVPGLLPHGGFPWRRATLMVWLLGVSIAIGRLIWAQHSLARLIRACPMVVDPAVLDLLTDCCRECGLNAQPSIRLAPAGIGPTLAGVLRPQLLLPQMALDMERRPLRFVLLHELRHIRAGDCVAACVVRWIYALHWFNPFVWLAAARWREERELACDAWVLRNADSGERQCYGHTLLTVLEDAAFPRATMLSPGMASSPGLIERRIREMKRPNRNSLRKRFAASVVALLLAAIGLTDAVHSEPAAKSSDAPAHAADSKAKDTTTAAPAKPASPKRKRLTIIVARHVILLDQQVFTWEQLEERLRDEAKAGPIVPALHFTIGSVPQYKERSERLMELHKELKFASWEMAFTDPNASRRLDAVRAANDLKVAPSRRREGVVLDPQGRPAVGATVIVRTKSEYECCIYLNNGDIRNTVDEVWTTTDDQGRFHVFPPEDNFVVAIFHKTGVASATAKQLETQEPTTLKPWAKVKVDTYCGLSVAWKDSAADAIQLNFCAFPRAQEEIVMPPGRVWVERFVKTKSGTQIHMPYRVFPVEPGASQQIEVEPPTAEEQAKAEELAKQNR